MERSILSVVVLTGMLGLAACGGDEAGMGTMRDTMRR
jgi:hypothetical protein